MEPYAATDEVGFPNAKLGAEGTFSHAQFNGRADFEASQFLGPTKFEYARFASPDEARFFGAHFARGVSFRKTLFAGKAEFSGVAGDRDATFRDTTFAGPISFSEAHFRVVLFGEPKAPETQHDGIGLLDVSEPTVFRGHVDLRGFIYDRIYANLDDLIKAISPYDGNRIRSWRGLCWLPVKMIRPIWFICRDEQLRESEYHFGKTRHTGCSTGFIGGVQITASVQFV